MGISWSDEELEVLRRVYPNEGTAGVVDALKQAGYHRSKSGVCKARKRYGITPRFPRIADAMSQYNIARKSERATSRGKRAPPSLDPMRPFTPDTIETILWFAQRGFTAEGIARELHRPASVIRDALRQTKEQQTKKEK